MPRPPTPQGCGPGNLWTTVCSLFLRRSVMTEGSGVRAPDSNHWRIDSRDLAGHPAGQVFRVTQPLLASGDPGTRIPGPPKRGPRVRGLGSMWNRTGSGKPVPLPTKSSCQRPITLPHKPVLACRPTSKTVSPSLPDPQPSWKVGVRVFDRVVPSSRALGLSRWIIIRH
jgi:hypothetical protein